MKRLKLCILVVMFFAYGVQARVTINTLDQSGKVTVWLLDDPTNHNSNTTSIQTVTGQSLNYKMVAGDPKATGKKELYAAAANTISRIYAVNSGMLSAETILTTTGAGTRVDALTLTMGDVTDDGVDDLVLGTTLSEGAIKYFTWNGSAWTYAYIFQNIGYNPVGVSLATSPQGNVQVLFVDEFDYFRAVEFISNQWQLVKEGDRDLKISAWSSEMGYKNCTKGGYDLNGDGYLDMVSGSDNGTIVRWDGLPAGTPYTGEQVYVRNEDVTAVGFGKVDINPASVLIGCEWSTLAGYSNLYAWSYNGSGYTFRDSLIPKYTTCWGEISALDAYDFDGDGYDEPIIVTNRGNIFRIWYDPSTSTYSYHQLASSTGQQFVDVVIAAIGIDCIPTSADFNGDCTVNMIDLASFAQQWLLD